MSSRLEHVRYYLWPRFVDMVKQSKTRNLERQRYNLFDYYLTVDWLIQNYKNLKATYDCLNKKG